jgi:hypothetical protein
MPAAVFNNVQAINLGSQKIDAVYGGLLKIWPIAPAGASHLSIGWGTPEIYDRVRSEVEWTNTHATAKYTLDHNGSIYWNGSDLLDGEKIEKWLDRVSGPGAYYSYQDIWITVSPSDRGRDAIGTWDDTAGQVRWGQARYGEGWTNPGNLTAGQVLYLGIGDHLGSMTILAEITLT